MLLNLKLCGGSGLFMYLVDHIHTHTHTSQKCSYEASSKCTHAHGITFILLFNQHNPAFSFCWKTEMHAGPEEQQLFPPIGSGSGLALLSGPLMHLLLYQEPVELAALL